MKGKAKTWRSIFMAQQCFCIQMHPNSCKYVKQEDLAFKNAQKDPRYDHWCKGSMKVVGTTNCSPVGCEAVFPRREFMPGTVTLIKNLRLGRP